MSYVSDHPTIECLLERTELVDKVAKRVRECKPPHVIGIYGDWGSGKTSFLRRLQLNLSGMVDGVDEAEVEAGKRSRDASYSIVPVVWFDAWRYQGESNPVVALLQEIRRQFSPGSRFFSLVRREAQVNLGAALLAMESLTNEIAKGVGSFIKNRREEQTRYETKTYSMTLPTDAIRNQFEHAIKTVLDSIEKDEYNAKDFEGFGEGKPNRLVIVIDDLDRCEAEVVERLLEGIKVYLNLRNCVFLIGVNPTRLIDHIASKYRSKGHPNDCKHAAKDYLDKIITAHYDLALPTDWSRVLDDVLRSDRVIEGTPARDHVRQALKIDPDCLPPNPRRVKLMMDTLLRYCDTPITEPLDSRLLVAFAYLHQFHPEIVRKLAHSKTYTSKFFEWCMAPTQANSFSPDEDDTRIQFEGLLPVRDLMTEEDVKLRLPDPIYDNVLHVHKLIHHWGDETGIRAPHEAWKPYILLA